MRSLRLYAAAGLSGACIALGLGGAPAYAATVSAITSHPAQHARTEVPGHAVVGSAKSVPEIQGCTVGLCLYNVYNGNIHQVLSCSPQTYIQGVQFSTPVDTAWNTCRTRVWFHQYADGGGLTECLSPGWELGVANGTWLQTPGNIQVTSNTNAC
jgi:hypothetical protein